MSGSLPPAGWYPDPEGRQSWRWWDGNRWTVSAAPEVPVAPPAGMWPGPRRQPLGDLLAAEERVSRWAAYAA
ncbi:MAG: DUF2510 domain-containing protein, partial [Acidimicrobiales bacterium]